MRDGVDSELTWLAQTDFRGQHRVFGMKQADRRAHLYLIGKTGTGKSSLLELLMRQDHRAGRGFALVDPHGDLLNRVLSTARQERPGDLIYFNVPDRIQPLSFNPLERVPLERRSLAAASLLEVFRKLWPESWGPRLEHILRNCLLALLELPEATLADVLRLLDEPTFRKSVAGRVSNAQVRRFWLHEFESYTARFRVEAIAPIQNKVGAFLADPTLNRILTQPRSSFDLRRIMDEGKVLLVNLAKGLIGEDATRLMGALLTAALGLAALSRVNVSEENRRDFHLYLDEFHTYATLSLATMLSELRKYRLGLVLAHQYLGQLEPPVRDAILGNVGTIVVFRVGLTDAELLAREFYPDFAPVDLINLPNHRAYVRVMIDGVVSKPFSAKTIEPAEAQSQASAKIF